MRITKIDQTIINLSAVEQYSSAIDDLILHKLKEKLENKCDKGAFILRVVSIYKRSKCVQTQNRLDGSCTVSVQYQVEALIYNKGDIISGCKIQHIERSNDILCEHENAIIRVKGSRIMQRLSPGMKIPVRVTKAQYKKSSDKIVIYGVPFTYQMNILIFNIDFDSIMTEQKDMILETIDKIETEQKNQKNLKILSFFDEVFYPFHQAFSEYQKKNKMPSDYSLTDMVDLLKGKMKKPTGKIICFRHPRLLASDPRIYIAEKVSNDKLLDDQQHKIQLVGGNSGEIIMYLLNEHLSYLNLLTSMAQEYDTEKKRNEHKALWDIYKDLKK